MGPFFEPVYTVVCSRAPAILSPVYRRSVQPDPPSMRGDAADAEISIAVGAGRAEVVAGFSR